MLPALRAGAIDAALSLCPEIAADFSYEVIRSEPVVALVAATHPLVGREALDLDELANDEFVLFPRELAPRLYDFMVGLCRRAGFEPRIRRQSFHSGWEMQILGDAPVVALAPGSVAVALPPGIAAVRVGEPPDSLETALVWRSDDESPTTAELRRVAATLFTTGVA
jgi:DNA-binding transcriptional LysR family regulator